MLVFFVFFFFFFTDTATTEIYTLSLHDALPISMAGAEVFTRELYRRNIPMAVAISIDAALFQIKTGRSEEHTSELQSQSNLVCRLLLEKKKKKKKKKQKNKTKNRKNNDKNNNIK